MCLTDALCPTYHVVLTSSVVPSPGLENQFNHMLEIEESVYPNFPILQKGTLRQNRTGSEVVLWSGSDYTTYSMCQISLILKMVLEILNFLSFCC